MRAPSANQSYGHRVPGIIRSAIAACAAAALAAAVVLCWPHAASAAEIDDGDYTIEGTVLQAASDSSSMAGAAFTQPMSMTVKDGKATLTVELKPVTTMGLTGYLGWLKYYPDYTGATTPKTESPTSVKVLSYYDESDSYNDASTGTDVEMKGRSYPKQVTLTFDEGMSQLFVQMYMPLMEDIVAGNGTQYARLQLDYDTLTPVEEPDEPGEGDDPDDPGDDPDPDDPDDPGADDSDDENLEAFYGALDKFINKANALLKKTDAYTAASLDALRTQRNAAQAMYEQGTAGLLDIFNQAISLGLAMANLEPVTASSQGGTGGSSSDSGNQGSAATTSLKMGSLADGTYTITGTMCKLDKSTKSMADAGIDHNITLTVSGGSYYLTIAFKAVTINSKSSYLSSLKYYKQGYKLSNGALTGSVAAAQVLSYQTSGGERLSDAYGTDYPLQVKMPLIESAKTDGLVPLQVFVPAMDAIASGTGTQQLFLVLDLSSIISGTTTKYENSSSQGSSTGSGSGSDSGTQQASQGTTLDTNTLQLVDAEDEQTAAVAQEFLDDVLSVQEDEDSSAGASTASAAATDYATQATGSDEEKQPPLKGALLPMGITLAAAVLAWAAWMLLKRKRRS